MVLPCFTFPTVFSLLLRGLELSTSAYSRLHHALTAALEPEGKVMPEITSPQPSWPLLLSNIHLVDKLVQGQLGSRIMVLPAQVDLS